MSGSHPDPYREADAQPDPQQLVAALEVRGRNANHARLTRRFLAFTGVGLGDVVLEVGCGTGVVLRALAARVGRRGRVVGVDPSRSLRAAAARILRGHPRRRAITVRAGDGARLPFPADRFDATLAVTVLLHVADPLAVVKEMVRVTRPGGVVAVQDQDFGTVALTHPDRPLSTRILEGVAGRMYEEPWSGRRLPGLLRGAGLEHVRLQTEVFQDTTLEPYTKRFLERRAENAVRFGLVDPPAAQRWLDAITAMVATGAFVLTVNYYGAVGVKPRRARA
ncbi:MAG: methyltransferase domain-containing protein [Candidatus Rokuibacteriota bacterium]